MSKYFLSETQSVKVGKSLRQCYWTPRIAFAVYFKKGNEKKVEKELRKEIESLLRVIKPVLEKKKIFFEWRPK